MTPEIIEPKRSSFQRVDKILHSDTRTSDIRYDIQDLVEQFSDLNTPLTEFQKQLTFYLAEGAWFTGVEAETEMVRDATASILWTLQTFQDKPELFIVHGVLGANDTNSYIEFFAPNQEIARRDRLQALRMHFTPTDRFTLSDTDALSVTLQPGFALQIPNQAPLMERQVAGIILRGQTEEGKHTYKGNGIIILPEQKKLFEDIIIPDLSKIAFTGIGTLANSLAKNLLAHFPQNR